MRQEIPIYAAAHTLAEIRQRFGYVFAPVEHDGAKSYYKPTLTPHVIEGPFTVAGIEVVPFRQDHGYSETVGFRFGRFAYSTDVVRLDDQAFAALEGVEVWIVDCIRREPHPTHSHLARTLDWVARLRPRRAILTHMDQSLDYETLCRELPPGVEPGHDGLVIEV
jgi:phosphoribosyl 1,2-cyclic phosphate phosphodiesterase